MTSGPNLMFDNLRLEVLLKNVASRVLRDVFTRRFKRSTCQEWGDAPGLSKDFLKRQSKGIKWMKIQRGKIDKGDLGGMDLAQLGQLLLQFRWTSEATTPNITEEEKRALEIENNLIKELKQVRNDHAHLSSSSRNKNLAESKLNEFWETVRRVLLELGGEGLTEEIDEIRNSEFAGLTYSDAALSEENMTKSRSLRDDGNKFLKENNLQKAVDYYSQALDLEGLSHVERGILYSNRCYVNLLLSETLSGDEAKVRLKEALEDARFTTVEHRPSWWKGFYRAAQVYKRMGELKPAVISCDHALNLLLNKEETVKVMKLRDEIRELAEKEGVQIDSSPDRPTEGKVIQDLKKYASECGIQLPVTKSLAESVDKLLNSADDKAIGMGSVLKGHCYFYGLGDHPQDITMGAKFYTKAVMKLNPHGFYYSGLCHLTGQGVPRIPDNARELLKYAAGSPETESFAMCALGKFYEADHGPGLSQDFRQAAGWYAKASGVGNGEASNLLACLYYEGKGVEGSKSEAKRYWMKAADQGYETAMERLATEYLEEGDLDEAERWFTGAIDAGCLSAFLNKHNFEDKLQAARSESRQVN